MNMNKGKKNKCLSYAISKGIGFFLDRFCIYFRYYLLTTNYFISQLNKNKGIYLTIQIN